MKLKTTTFAMMLVAGASLAAAQDSQDSRQREQRRRCPEESLEPCGGPHHEEFERREARRAEHPRRVWDPNLAQWRTEHPREVWDPNLAQYRQERRDEVWDPYLARYRPRDARKDPPPPARAHPSRHRHPGRNDWCSERH